jgi:sortase (surface protein transpeptidase)
MSLTRRLFLLLICAVLSGACAQHESRAVSVDRRTAQPHPHPTLMTTSYALLDTPILDDEPHAPSQTPAPTPVEPLQSTPISTPAPVADIASDTLRRPVVERIVIDEITLDRAPIPVGLGDRGVPIVPRHDIGWFEHSATPGQDDNIVLWGHALRFRSAPEIPAPFGRLKDLAPGARVVLYDQDDTAHTYVVTQQVWATPKQVEYILPLGVERVTLISCIGDRVITDHGVDMTHRLITIAEPLS